VRDALLKARQFSAILVLAAFLPIGVAGAQNKVSADALADLEKVAKAYRIQIVTSNLSFPVQTTYGAIDGRSAGRKALENYSSLFVSEFTLYPPDLVRRAQLKRVVLSSELTFGGQRRNAIPDYEHHTLYLDVSRGAYSNSYLRKVIHHEFFHIIDYLDDGNVYSDERWESLNPAEFKYGSGGRTAQDLQQTSVLTDKFSGFLNHYSTTGVEEDKAELLANLIVNPTYVEDRATKDHVLKAKVARLRELLVSFCPDMNDEFWEKVRKMKRPGVAAIAPGRSRVLFDRDRIGTGGVIDRAAAMARQPLPGW